MAEWNADWESLKQLALALDLPFVVEATTWGNPCLKAHKKLWTWWSPHENAPVFKMAKEEREFLIEADPETFFVTDHYRSHNLVLVHPASLDPEWAKAHLVRSWREIAPKRVLQAWEKEQGGS